MAEILPSIVWWRTNVLLQSTLEKKPKFLWRIVIFCLKMCFPFVQSYAILDNGTKWIDRSRKGMCNYLKGGILFWISI